MVIKRCKICGDELPATIEFFHQVKGNKDGLHGSCKECRKNQAKDNEQRRRDNGQYLKFEHTCGLCRKEYVSEKENQMFCSRECQIEWVKTDREYRTVNIERSNKQYSKTLKQRELSFKEKFEGKFEDFIYHSGYMNSSSKFKRVCKKCGSIEESTTDVIWNDSKSLVCKGCKAIKDSRRKMKDVLIKYINKLEEPQREIERKEHIDKLVLIKDEKNKLKRIKQNHEYYNVCEECGRRFFSSINKATCGSKCSNKRSNRMRYVKRRKKIITNGEADYTISIYKIIKRHGVECHLCGEVVDTNDCYTRSDGTFIAGNNYPSIDHVIPISKGGTHSWDNVKLAHRRCNSIKSNKIGIEYNNLKACNTMYIDEQI